MTNILHTLTSHILDICMTCIMLLYLPCFFSCFIPYYALRRMLYLCSPCLCEYAMLGHLSVYVCTYVLDMLHLQVYVLLFMLIFTTYDLYVPLLVLTPLIFDPITVRPS